MEPEEEEELRRAGGWFSRKYIVGTIIIMVTIALVFASLFLFSYRVITHEDIIDYVYWERTGENGEGTYIILDAVVVRYDGENYYVSFLKPENTYVEGKPVSWEN